MSPTLPECYKANRATGMLPPVAIRAARVDFARGRLPFRYTPAPTPAHGDVVRFRDASGARQTAVVAWATDDDTSPPWKREEGHGPVTDWTTRDKRPGELVLNREGRHARYYDFAEAVKIARRDGWNAEPYSTSETAGQRAQRAAMADFERLRDWCNDSWRYVGVCLFLLPRDGVERSPEYIANEEPFGILHHAALWGIESDSDDYLATVALELTAEL